MVINPKIIGWALIAIAFIWLIGAETVVFISKKKHRSIRQTIQLILPNKVITLKK